MNKLILLCTAALVSTKVWSLEDGISPIENSRIEFATVAHIPLHGQIGRNHETDTIFYKDKNGRMSGPSKQISLHLFNPGCYVEEFHIHSHYSDDHIMDVARHVSSILSNDPTKFCLAFSVVRSAEVSDDENIFNVEVN